MTTTHTALIALALASADLDALAQILRELIRGGDNRSARALALSAIEAGASWTIEDAEHVARPVFGEEDWLADGAYHERWIRVCGVRVPGVWDRQRDRLFACALVESLLPRFAEERPNDTRPLDTVELARQCAYGHVDRDECRDARSAARAASRDAMGSRAAMMIARAAARTAVTWDPVAWRTVSALVYNQTVIDPAILDHDALDLLFLRWNLGEVPTFTG